MVATKTRGIPLLRLLAAAGLMGMLFMCALLQLAGEILAFFRREV